MPIIDARSLPDGENITCNLCIVGAGPIGLSLANALSGPGRDVVLVESGRETRSQEIEDLSGGETRGNKYAPLTMYRRRVLGGASTIWGGRCVPYDPIDFEKRGHPAYGGWPFDHETITPYYAKAMDLADAGEPNFDAQKNLPHAAPLIEGFRSNVVETVNLERFSLPTNFWKKLGPELKSRVGLRILTDATCTKLHMNSTGKLVTKAKLQGLDGKVWSVKAQRFIIAAGGIETYRILATSTDVYPNGIGNTHDVLGRYFMSHIEGNFATLQLTPPKRPVHWGFDISNDGIYMRRRFQISKDVQRREGLHNTIVRLHHPNAVNPDHRNGILSSMFLAKNFILPEYRNKITMVERSASAESYSGPSFWAQHLRNLALDAPQIAFFAIDWIRKRHLATRRIPYVVLRSSVGRYPLDFNAEQEPHKDSRLQLSNQFDRFGVRHALVNWSMTQSDVWSVARTLEILKAEFEASGVGTILFPDGKLIDTVEREAVPIGGHHIGMARMHESPHFGVVNADLRVHGVGNLYLASTAVLPTSSHANPTLMTLCLALRLADHLKSEEIA
jgi:choline dehydrogenase-like flavoprotein